MTDQQRLHDILGAAGQLAPGRSIQLSAIVLGYFGQIRTEERKRAAQIARSYEVTRNSQYEDPYGYNRSDSEDGKAIAAKIMTGNP